MSIDLAEFLHAASIGYEETYFTRSHLKYKKENSAE
jgi:hypothetical protein